MAVTLGIGPSPQDITTTYSYDAGLVELGPRPATVRTAVELLAIVRSIRSFRAAVLATDTPDVGSPVPPFGYELKVAAQTAGLLSCEFRCAAQVDNFEIEAEQDLATRVTSFGARDGATITWGDFELLVSWMSFLGGFARR